MASQYEIMAPSTESGERYDSTENGQYVAEAVADDEDDRNMDEIAQAIGDFDVQDENLGASDDNIAGDEEGGDTNAELTSPTSRGQYTVPTGATPMTQTGVLSSHAAEFWFPESRSCTCCNGFKHGCRCAKEQRLTACKECAGAYPAAALPVPPSHGNRANTGPSFIVTPPPAIKGSPAGVNDNDEDERNMAELDKEIGGSGDYGDGDEDEDEFNEEFPSEGKPGGVLPSGAMPVQQNGLLSEHAAEFWFPNCRECSCCKGFKYGCPCTRHRGFLACQDATCNIDANEKDVKSNKAVTPKSARSPSNSASMMCKFEASPSGCNFGANCRFKHANSGYAVAAPDAAGGAYYGQYVGQPPTLTRATTFPSANGVSDAAICRFFLSGGCMYGESCRYKHGY